ncbi:hypothetical protein AURANDRAFT_69172, partial [Aureococcus anophagefferens]
STKSDTYRAMAQSCSSPEIQRRCNGSLAESNSVAAMTSRDQGYQIESAEPRLGISVAEVMQRLVTDEVLHAVDARHIHRLLASNDKTARDVVMQLEQAGTVTCRAQY